MAGETVRTEALCLRIHPWSRTSHVVSWLTPRGVIGTLVKGAVRPKSFFLGQYDLNYTCEILYYARGRGDLHALRECAPVRLREGLRGDWRALALADYFRELARDLTPSGPEAEAWCDLLRRALDGLDGGPNTAVELLSSLLRFESGALGLMGLAPDFTGFDPTRAWSPFSVASGVFVPDAAETDESPDGSVGTGFLRTGASPVLRISTAVARGLCRLDAEKKWEVLLDAARVFSVFYSFHLDRAVEGRRSVLRMICNK